MKSIFFDLYGTLVDIHTDENKVEVWTALNNFFEKAGKTLPDLKNQFFTAIKEVENSLLDYDIVTIFQDLSGLDENICIQAAQLFREKSIDHLKLFDGVASLLKTLKEKGYNIYLLSNAQAVFTILELKKLEIYDFFDEIFISSLYKVKKPNLDFYNLAITKTASSYTSSMMIGNDYQNDIEPAQKLGLKTIFIYTEGQTPKIDIKADLPNGFEAKQILKLISERLG